MRRRSAFTAALGILLLAGCTSAPPPSGLEFDPDWASHAVPTGQDHVHEDPLHHLNLTTPNFRVIAHDPLNSTFYGGPPGSTLCGDAGEVADGRRIAVIESRSKVGFTLADVTDAAHPKWLGELVMENTHVYDVAVVPDGKHIVAVTSRLVDLPVQPPIGAAIPSTDEDPSSGLLWNSPCAPQHTIPFAASLTGADPIPAPHQALLVDIRDPANPVIVDRQPLTSYGHSAVSTIIDGRTWVLVAMAHGPYPPGFPEVVTSGWAFYEVQSTSAGTSRLNLLSTYFVRGDTLPDPNDLGDRSHDGWMQKHPITQQTLAYLVGGERLTIVDMANPMQPQPIAEWKDSGPAVNVSTGNMHSALPLDQLWNGKHYTIIGPEWGDHPVGTPTGIIWVLDTTDPTAPKEVAAWTLPVDPEWSGTYMFSNHYYSVHNTTLFVSMYHGGVWAVDLSPILVDDAADFVSLDSIGVFMPVDPDANPAVKVRWAPTLEEVIAFKDGTLVTFDSFSGLWTFAFDETQPAPAPRPWVIRAPHGPTDS